MSSFDVDVDSSASIYRRIRFIKPSNFSGLEIKTREMLRCSRLAGVVHLFVLMEIFLQDKNSRSDRVIRKQSQHSTGLAKTQNTAR